MDDRRIRQLTEEVLARLRGGPAPAGSDLETRVAALEAAVRELRAALDEAPPRAAAPRPPGPPAPTAVAVAIVPSHPHPSLQVLGVASGSERCVLEPDKPCVASGQCRALGH